MQTTLDMQPETELTTIGNGGYEGFWAASGTLGIVVDDDRIGANPINRTDPTGLTSIPYAPNWLNNLVNYFSPGTPQAPDDWSLSDGWYGGLQNDDPGDLSTLGQGISNILHYGFNTSLTGGRHDEGEYGQESFYARSIRASLGFKSERDARLAQIKSAILKWSKDQGDKAATGFMQITVPNIDIDTGDGGANGKLYWVLTQLTLGRVSVSVEPDANVTQRVNNSKVEGVAKVHILYQCVDPWHLHIDDLTHIPEPGRFTSYITWEESLTLHYSRGCAKAK